MYYLLAIVAAFGQASTWAYKKSSLDREGLNNILGSVSFTVAAVILTLLWMIFGTMPNITYNFMVATAIVVAVNVVALWNGYKAMQIAGYSDLMPLMALTSLGIVPLEYVLRGSIPSLMQIIGISIIVIGAIVSVGQWPKLRSKKALAYFAITVSCYTIAPPFMAIAVKESGSALFSAAVFHALIGIAFLPLIFISGEYKKVKNVVSNKRMVKVTWRMVVAGMLTSLVENGPGTLALQYASASIVFALKRVMPIFALVIGKYMFEESVTPAKIIGSLLLIAGAVFILLG